MKLFIAPSCSCSRPARPTSPIRSRRKPPPDEVVVLTHDSFAVSKKVLAEFTERTGQKVKIVQNGDTGQVVNAAILSAGSPQGDVLFGVDNTFLSRAQKAGVFLDYQAPASASDLAQQAPGSPDRHRCRVSELRPGVLADRPAPTGPADLVEPQYRDLTVVQNPATSSPGLAFLLSTVSAQPDWQQYWRDLKDNGVKVVDGWDNAYYQQFSGGSGEGTRPIVVSYSHEPRGRSHVRRRPAGAAAHGQHRCGLLPAGRVRRGARWCAQRSGSQAVRGLHALAQLPGRHRFADVRVPGGGGATVPKAFEEYAPEPTDPVVMDPEQIADGRDEWIDQWSAIME